MKISFMTFACPEWSLEQVIEAARRHDYQGIEFRCDARHHHGVEVYADKSERKRIRQLLNKARREACCLATSLQFAGEQVYELAPPRIELAADIGCPALRVFAGPWPQGANREQVIEEIGRRLREMARLAEPRGVQLWLETHDTMSRGADAAAAVRSADHPLVGVNYDNMHPYRCGEKLPDTIAALRGMVRHTHLHDAVNSAEQVLIRPFGQGDMPLDDVFKALLAMDYEGYISGEWFRDNYGANPDDALERFRQDVTDLAQRHGAKIG